MKVYPRILGFEVTRRCNLSCPHCMRGEAQDLDMGINIVKSVLDCISSLNYINFTGGEPSLNNSCIRSIINEIKSRNIEVYGFDVVSNGVDSDKISELINILSEFKNYCFDKRIDTSRLAISRDIYHPDCKLSKFDCNFEIINRREDFDLLNLGRARDLDCKKIKHEKHTINVIRQDDYSIMINNGIIISANGDVRLSVDYEYSSQDDVIGNVLVNSLSDIVLREIELEKTRVKHWWY